MSSYEKMTGGIYQMNKTELIAAVAEKAELSKKDAEKAIKAFTDVVSDELGQRISIKTISTGRWASAWK